MLGPTMAALCGALLYGTTRLPFEAVATAEVTVLCAAWWVLEPVPIAVTSLIPFVAFPLLSVSTHRAVAAAYGHTLILLLLGGFILSKAVEHCGAHRRIALGMLRLTGGSGRRLVLGFMLASAVCSMWISNTATTLMLLPVAQAILSHSRDDKLHLPLLLGIAYAASIGGIATPIGTPPNVFFMAFYDEKTGHEFGFLPWMRIGLPVVVVLLPLCWWLLTRRLQTPASGPPETVSLPALGPWRKSEARVLMVFGATAAAWIFRGAPFGGWSGLLDTPGVGDSTIALAAVVAVFLVPSGQGDGKGLLDWKTAESIPWGLLLLFGGGIAIAKAFDSSGLALSIGHLLEGTANAPTWLVIGLICLSVTFLTEVMSNTATTTLLMPLLYAAARATEIQPELLLIPATISASCAFMLPVATAPNAIVFATGAVHTRQMARAGLALNVLAALAVAAISPLLIS
jgi:sodium-dependent dicarboxylate transporter 2/3/5